jgi:hypothetical protein
VLPISKYSSGRLHSSEISGNAKFGVRDSFMIVGQLRWRFMSLVMDMKLPELVFTAFKEWRC